jgi:hypothetical protein
MLRQNTYIQTVIPSLSCYKIPNPEQVVSNLNKSALFFVSVTYSYKNACGKKSKPTHFVTRSIMLEISNDDTDTEYRYCKT